MSNITDTTLSAGNSDELNDEIKTLVLAALQRQVDEDGTLYPATIADITDELLSYHEDVQLIRKLNKARRKADGENAVLIAIPAIPMPA